MTIKKFLLGIDFSVHSRKALEAVAKLFPSSKIYALHAYTSPYGGLMFRQDEEDISSKGFQEVMEQSLKKEAKAFFAGLPANFPKIELIFRQGSIYSVMEEEVRKIGAHLIAIGSHGKSGAFDVFLGSFAEDLLTNPPVDVLAVNALV